MFRLRREFLSKRLFVVSVLTGVSVICYWFMVESFSSADRDLQKKIPEQVISTRILELQQRIRHLESETRQVKNENSALKQNATVGKQIVSDRSAKELTWFLSRPENGELLNLEQLSNAVTIILYQSAVCFGHCLQKRKTSITNKFPNLKVLTSNENDQTVGAVFNSLFPRVKTKYFLFLDSSVEIAEFASDNSAGLLIHALENIPELDFISGSILSEDRKLEVPCYRLLLCNWTLTQRYEYERSVGDVMICENIASSFIGKTKSIERVFGSNTPPFDEELPEMSTTDFFIRAKQKGCTSGVRPEVMLKFGLDREGTPANSQKRDTQKKYFQSLLPFAKKHKVFRFKDADSNMLELCTNDSPIAGEDICDEAIAHQDMLSGSHLAFKGTFAYPYIIDNLQDGMLKIADFFDSQNITYFIDGGVALGALKMRAILPWDSGDVDMGVHIESKAKLFNLLESFARGKGYTVTEVDDSINIFCTPTKVGKTMGGIVTLFVNNVPLQPDPSNFMMIKTNGKWIRYGKDLFRHFRKIYGASFLQHRMYKGNKPTHCEQKGHNACLPDFRTLLKGTAGTFKEYFCES